MPNDWAHDFLLFVQDVMMNFVYRKKRGFDFSFRHWFTWSFPEINTRDLDTRQLHTMVKRYLFITTAIDIREEIIRNAEYFWITMLRLENGNFVSPFHRFSNHLCGSTYCIGLSISICLHAFRQMNFKTWLFSSVENFASPERL